MKKLKKQLKKMNKIAVYSLSFGILVVVFGFGWPMASAIWQEPLFPPVSNNIAAPISLDDLNEAKAGGLIIDPGGSLDIKNSKLRVVGEMRVNGTSMAVGGAVAGELQADTDTLTVANNSVGMGMVAADPNYKLSVVNGLVRSGSETSPITGPGVYSASSNSIGIQARISTGGGDWAAVYGENTATSGLSYGVYGKSNAGSAVYGFSSSGKGVYAYTTTADTTNNIAAVAGENTVTAGSYWAGYFKGRLQATDEVLGSKFLPTKLQNSLVPFTAGSRVADYLTGPTALYIPTGLVSDGTYIYVAIGGAVGTPNNKVYKYRASDGTKLAEYTVGTSPSNIIFDGNFLWVANSSSNSVSKIRVLDGVKIGDYNTGTQPIDLVFDGSYIWVANRGSNNVSKLKASDGTKVTDYAIGSSPQAITYDGTYIWTANNNQSSNQVTRIKISDGNIQNFTIGGIYPRDIIFDGTYIWTANNSYGVEPNVSKIYAETGENVANYSYQHWGSVYPASGIAFDGTFIWLVYGPDEEFVERIQAADGTLAVSYYISDTSSSVHRSIYFDGTYLWMTNDTKTISKLFSGTGWGHTDLSSLVNLSPSTAQNGSFYITGTSTFGGALQVTNGDLSVAGNTWGASKPLLDDVPVSGDNTYNCRDGTFLKGIEVDASRTLLKLLCRAL